MEMKTANGFLLIFLFIALMFLIGGLYTGGDYMPQMNNVAAPPQQTTDKFQMKMEALKMNFCNF